jgi:hypothetical protein
MMPKALKVIEIIILNNKIMEELDLELPSRIQVDLEEELQTKAKQT